MVDKKVFALKESIKPVTRCGELEIGNGSLTSLRQGYGLCGKEEKMGGMILAIICGVLFIAALFYYMSKKIEKQAVEWDIEKHRREKITRYYLIGNPKACFIQEIIPGKEYLIYPPKELPESVDLDAVFKQGLANLAEDKQLEILQIEQERYFSFDSKINKAQRKLRVFVKAK